MSMEATKVPRHIAIIMDGNGRWAKARGLPRLEGHRVGAESVRAALRACRKLGVEYLTLYAFSSENWVRPRAEVTGLMSLLRRFLRDQGHELHENRVRLRAVGHLEDLPAPVLRELNLMIEETRDYREGNLILALSYGGRAELLDAFKGLAAEVARGDLKPARITEESIRRHLYLPEVPDPDLMIRTSGELRISNFLLWQLSYTELYFTDVLWPDFREPHLLEAVHDYQRRHRRFGDVK
jgi:undecaprenyl diphosphate synthase